MKEFIISSAVKGHKDIFIGKRHHNCFEQMREFRIKPPYDNENWEQGFLTSKMRFIDRQMAVKVALLSNQIIDLQGMSRLEYALKVKELYSEDIF